VRFRDETTAVQAETSAVSSRLLETGASYRHRRWKMAYLQIAVVVFIVAVVLRAVFLRRAVILEYERGLKYSNGRFKGILAPGPHWILKRTTTVTKVDVRTRFAPVSGQELLSADGVPIKVTIAAEYQIVDPAAAVNSVQSYDVAFYQALQVALRDIIGSTAIDEILAKRGELSHRLTDIASKPIEAFGLKLNSASIKDIMLPGEVKKIFTQVVKARQEGLAALERARGETAALRNLANAARLLDHSPSLMQLRALQCIGESTGNTFVMGVPAAGTPLMVKERPAETPRAEAPVDAERSSE
jgi:regulator of protease activity HflC (stomatin/prohibitin superfamily)